MSDPDKVQCLLCSGLGRVAASDGLDPTGDPVWDTCPRCNGAGEIEGDA